MSLLTIERQIEQMVLTVHRRNGGTLAALDGQWRLLDKRLALDSLDLAEIMVAIERQFGVSPFEAPQPPRTWKEVIAAVARTFEGSADWKVGDTAG